MDDSELEAIRARKLSALQSSIANRSLQAGPVHLTDDTFEQEMREGMVLVDFWAAWCRPCLQFAPTFEAMAHDYAGKVKFGKLNVDENPRTAQAYGIQAIPTILLFKDGAPVEGIQGAVPRAQLQQVIDSWL